MELQFATTREDELHEILAIDPVAAHNQLRRNYLLDRVCANQCLSVRHRGELVAFTVVTQNFFYQNMLELLVVRAECRRQGLGQHILGHVIGTYADPQLWTSTNASNVAMRALLAKLGFKFCGTVSGLDEGDPEMFFRITTSHP